MKTVHAALVALAIALLPASALARVDVRVSGVNGSSATVELTNNYAFEVKVVNVRLDYMEDDGSRTFVYSVPGLDEDLPAGGSWSGTVTFGDPGGHDLAMSDGTSVAAGVDIEAIAGPAEAALEDGDMDTILELLGDAREKVAPVSRSSRFHADQIAEWGGAVDEYFDLERMDGLVESLETALCETASARILGASNNTTRQTVYEELAPWLRDAGLHITCINSEAKLAAARMLIAGSRPQDALLFKETDEDGNLLPEWEPIFITANLALARTAAELEVTVLSSLRPALEALNEVQDLAPEHEELASVAGRLVPRIGAWIQEACGELNRDIENAEALLRLLRPRWDHIAATTEAANVFADALLAEGLRFCEQRQFINARNRFVRGEEVLDGIESWEEQRDEINRCRAMGALDEGRELAALSTDPEAPERGYAKLEEALGRFDLSDEVVAEFEADIAQAWVDVAMVHLEDFGFSGARHALENGEERSPTGRTDAMKEAWLTYAEARYERGGFFMDGADVEDARDAVERAEDVDPDRSASISSSLTMAFYGYRVGIPALAFLGLLIAGGVTLMNRRKAKKYEDMLDDDMI